VHIHLVDFRILERNGAPPEAYELGPKDTAYVGEGETVRVLMRFGPYSGRYMMHCHNLVHEDHDMMVQFEVGAGGDDPIAADRPRRQPAPELRGDGPDPGSSPTSGPGSEGAPARQPAADVAGSVKPMPKPRPARRRRRRRRRRPVQRRRATPPRRPRRTRRRRRSPGSRR
jgi:spore coat protein A, manganese oxidase